MSNVKICNNKKITKLNNNFYMTPEGDVLKYKKYCIINDCKKLGSFNSENKKEFLYCNEHKLPNMINIRKGYVLCKEHNISYSKDSFCKECEKMNCLLCNQTVNKSHYFSTKHINNFDKNITITIKNCIKKKFIDIIFDFHIIHKDTFYKDLYFKDKVKSLILKHCKKDKNYKVTIYKYNQSVRGDLTNYWIEKFNIDNISEIDYIDKLNLKNFKNLKAIDFEDQIGFDREGYDGTNDLENIDILGGNIQSGGSIKIIQNTRLVVKISECQLFSAGDSKEIGKMPELFFKKRNLIIMKNLNDNKCLLYSYIRKHLNPITVNPSRISKKDIEISKELIDEFNIDFENVSIGEIDEIENFLECNIHVFGCDENLYSKKIIKKSLKNYDKDLNLLLIDGINHNILIKDINKFISNNSHFVKSCRNCLNSFYSEEKYKFHIECCRDRKQKKIFT